MLERRRVSGEGESEWEFGREKKRERRDFLRNLLLAEFMMSGSSSWMRARGVGGGLKEETEGTVGRLGKS